MTLTAIKASDGIAPTKDEVKNELLVFWDGYSPLSIGALTQAYDKEKTLAQAGLDDREAKACVNKYNSLIFRCPGKGPLVTASEAENWLDEKMQKIVDTVMERAQPK